MEQPLLSIITVVNNDQRIMETFKSIETFSSFDIINKLEFIVKATHDYDMLGTAMATFHRARLYVCHDSGIYDGMNFAAKCAKGKYLYFLNAGDTLIVEGLLNAINLLIHDDIEVLCMNTLNSHRGITSLIPFSRRPGQKFGPLFGVFTSHQGYIIKRSSFLALNGFRIETGLSADHELMAKAFYTGMHHVFLDFPVAVFDLSGASQLTHPLIRYLEIIRWILPLQDAPLIVRIFSAIYWFMRLPFALIIYFFKI